MRIELDCAKSCPKNLDCTSRVAHVDLECKKNIIDNISGASILTADGRKTYVYTGCDTDCKFLGTVLNGFFGEEV